MIVKQFLKMLAVLAVAVFITGCGDSRGLSGTVADGLAMANAKVTIQSADGNVMDVGTTNGQGEYAGFSIPVSFQFPAILSVIRSDNNGVLRAIIPIKSETVSTANINPITEVITSQLLPEGTSLSSLYVGTGGDGFAQKAKNLVQVIFGNVIDYDAFATRNFKARTKGDFTAGGLADALIDTIAGIDAAKKPEDLLASATSSTDSTLFSSLMTTPAFQARLVGTLIAQGRSTNAVKTLISSGVDSGTDTTDLLVNVETYAKSFEDVYTSATTELTIGGTDKRKALEVIVGSVAVTVAKIVEKKKVAGGNSLTNVLTNSLTVIKAPMISIGKDHQNSSDLNLILSTTGNHVAEVVAQSTVDLTTSGVNTTSLGNQVKNFGKIVSSTVANSLQSGKDKNGLKTREKRIIASNLGKGIASSLTTYMNVLAVDATAMTDAQKASLTKAGNTAVNAATALDSVLVGIAANKDADSLDDQVLDSMASALVIQASETFKSYDLSVDAASFDTKATRVLTNMGTAMINNAIVLATSAATLNANRKAALTWAMAGQLFSEIKTLDLTGDTPPTEALNVAANLAKAVGPALVEKVGQGSIYGGSNLQMLAASAVSSATTELKKNVALTGEIDTATLKTLEQTAATKVESTKTTLETSFKSVEAQGISLGDITNGLVDAGLQGSAVDVVFAQVQDTLSSGGDVMKSAAGDVAKTAASMASTVLQKGGSLSQVQTTIASPLASMAQVAQGKDGISSAEIFTAIQNSASILGQSANTLAASRNLSLTSLISSMDNVAAVVGTQLQGDAANTLLEHVRGNAGTGDELKLDAMAKQLTPFDGNILSQATAQQAAIKSHAAEILKATNKLPEFVPFTEPPTVDTGKIYNGQLSIKGGQDGKTLTFKIVTNGEKGTATITDSRTGAFTYQPNPDSDLGIYCKFGDCEYKMDRVLLPNTVNGGWEPAVHGEVVDISDEKCGITEFIQSLSFSGAESSQKVFGQFTGECHDNSAYDDSFSFVIDDGVGQTNPVSVTVRIVLHLFEPILTITYAHATEGNAGSSNVDFTVELWDAPTTTVTVDYTTAPVGGVTPGTDYTPVSGTLTFNPGETKKTISVPVLGDTIDEANETFHVTLSNAVNATIGNALGEGTIFGDAWPNLSFTNNNNGTVTDNLTGLIWLTNANCFGTQNWDTALASANALASGSCGLTDGSVAGNWRLPNINELESLIDYGHSDPTLPTGHVFSEVQTNNNYWSGSTYASGTSSAWSVNLFGGNVNNGHLKSGSLYVWPVRGGQ